MASLLLAALLSWYSNTKHFALSDDHLQFALIALAIWTIVTAITRHPDATPGARTEANTGIYRAWRGTSIWVEVGTVFKNLFLVVVVTAFFSYEILGTLPPRLFYLEWFGIAFILLSINRTLIRQTLRWLRRKGYNYRKIIIVGAGQLGQQIATTISSSIWTGLEVVGFFDDNPDKEISEEINKLRILGAIDEVPAYLRNNEIDQVWLVLPLNNEKRVQQLISKLDHQFVEILYVPDIFGFKMLNHTISEIAGIPTINLTVKPIEGMNRLLKKIEDMFFALVFLILLSPIMLLISILVKTTSKGPILFKQKRHGFYGETIEVWKFRTMYMHQEQQGEVAQATRGDPRITRIGGILRRLSFDEFPQFINVLQGRMSIVGPRPHAIEHNHYYKEHIDRYMWRHFVKPGITGWAQVNGFRGETETMDKMEQRINYDLYYIENWSFWFDLRIIFSTAFGMFSNKDVY
ncbi:MAG: undecaprenyl-phosphate glucose phosphotransferase [Magnetococcales bacterium]|nr:undecaprenyl-phosphate glucose phosphotransferase [Magnetococcales bacterium]